MNENRNTITMIAIAVFTLSFKYVDFGEGVRRQAIAVSTPNASTIVVRPQNVGNSSVLSVSALSWSATKSVTVAPNTVAKALNTTCAIFISSPCQEPRIIGTLTMLPAGIVPSRFWKPTGTSFGTRSDSPIHSSEAQTHRPRYGTVGKPLTTKAIYQRGID